MAKMLCLPVGAPAPAMLKARLAWQSPQQTIFYSAHHGLTFPVYLCQLAAATGPSQALPAPAKCVQESDSGDDTSAVPVHTDLPFFTAPEAACTCPSLHHRLTCVEDASIVATKQV